VRAERVSKTWRAGGRPVHAVRESTLAVAPGEAVVITGPSGSGKTTLLCMLGGLLRPDAGRVVLDGVDLAAADEGRLDAIRLERVGFVFQRGLLLDRLTVRANVALVQTAAGRSHREAVARADALLARLGLGGRGDVLPPALSAGERQRVALARALANRPRVVLADEPTAHLDSEAGATVAGELRRLAVEDAAALVIVTHDERLAAIGTRALRLADGTLA
jgi:putative ABC transport system ATP-binding protein